MSKYTPATFQPTVRPDWAGILSYLSDTEKSEILTALFKYPSDISEKCQSAFWKETIKPDLDLQYQAFTESCKAKSRGVRNRWGKISITDVEDMNKTSIRHDIDTEREREREEKKPGGVGGIFVPPKDANQVYEYGAANGMVCTMKDAEDFFDYYSGIGWRIGNEHRTPMVAWEPFWKKWLRSPLTTRKGPSGAFETESERKARLNHEKLEELKRKSLEAQKRG